MSYDFSKCLRTFSFFSDTGLSPSKPVYKKENGASDHAGSSSVSGQSGNHSFYQYPSHRLSVIIYKIVLYLSRINY